jgi:hypothetical protein
MTPSLIAGVHRGLPVLLAALALRASCGMGKKCGMEM